MKAQHAVSSGFAVALSFLLSACATTYPRQSPQGAPFPEVHGKSLDGSQYVVPRDLLGAPSLLLVGYEQNTQFDLDRWLLGLSQAGIDVRVFELPTIPGLFPGLFASKIDEGMRSGIPPADWAVVITVYDDAEKIARFTGNENRLPGRVILLDDECQVAYFHDEGFTVTALMGLRQALAGLEGGGRP